MSLIDRKIVEETGWKISPRYGQITQAFEGRTKPRIGTVVVTLKAGKSTVETELEVADLSSNTELIIGMNLFQKLGFKLGNIPISWPVEEEEII